MRLRMVAALLSLLGLLVSAYLFLYKLGYVGTLACGTGGCETVQLSPYSRFLGLDVAFYGVVGYAALLGLSLTMLQTPVGLRTRLGHLLLILSGGGVLFAAYLTYLELFVIHAICQWCVASAVIIIGIFLTAVADWRQAPARNASPQGDAPAR